MNVFRKIKRISKKWHLVSLLLVLVTSAIVVIILVRSWGQFIPQRIIVASSIPMGTYEKVIQTIEQKIKVYNEELGFRLNLKEIRSNGSVETLNQLERGQVDIGIVQGNSNISRKSGGVVLALYDEVYLLFTKRPESGLGAMLENEREKNGRIRIACLGPGSQTAIDAHVILEYFGAASMEYELVESTYPEARERLLDDSVDAALFVTGLGQPIIRDIVDEPGVKILPLSDTPSIAKQFRGVEIFTLEQGVFEIGVPASPIQTLSTPAMLVASNNVQKAVASRLSKTLTAHRWEVEKELPFLNIHPPSEAFQSLLHPGVAIESDLPSAGFFTVYSEHLKLCLAIPAALLALFTFLNNFKKTAKPAVVRQYGEDGAF